MTRSTRNIVLGLIGSAGLLCCCVPSCIDYRDEEVKDENGQIVRHHRHYYFRPWYYSGWGGSYGRSYGPVYAPTPGPRVGTGGTSGGGSRTSTGVTTRGGFGSTGHATSGG
jgi:hypothetical protein